MLRVLLILNLVFTCFASNTTIFNGSEIFPVGHSCSKCCFKEFKYLDFDDKMNPCDILSSMEGNAFLLVNPTGILEIYKDDIVTWSSCDEYIHIYKQCHHTSTNAQLFLDNNTRTLTLLDSIQSRITWSKKFNDDANSNGYTLQLNDKGHLILFSGQLNTIWTSDTQFDSEGHWTLILSHNCSTNAYFTKDTARQIGTISDSIFSDLIKLSELKYQKDSNYLFKMRWPESLDILDLVWKQSTNPSADFAVSSFDSLMDPYQRITWSGLALSSETYSDRSLINGDNSGQWALPIAVYNDYTNSDDGCIPGPNNEYKHVHMVQLWVKQYDEIPINAGESFITQNENKDRVKGELMIVGFPEEPIIESNRSEDWPVISIQRILGKTGEIEAFCVTQDGTAIQDQDYIYTKKEFKWLDQETFTKTMQIPIIDDDEFEFDEYFMVHCESLASDVPISRQDIKIVIKGPNDMVDGTAMVLRNTDIIWINESINHLILQIQPTFHENDLTVKYTTETINAICGEEDQTEISDDIDYFNVSGILYWSSNDEEIKNITVQIIDDSLWEYDECFNFILYNEETSIIYDNVTVCIYANDDPMNCSDIIWSDWSDCNVQYGIGQRIRYKNIGIPDFIGTIHCETKVESQSCTGNMSYVSKPDIILSSHFVNLSENGMMYNLAQSSKITFKITTMPVSNYNDIKFQFLEMDSLMEIVIQINPDSSNFIDFEPAYIAFNDKDWSDEKVMTFNAIDDNAFTAIEVIIEIEFKINSVDNRYHNISIAPLFIHIWDDDLLSIDIIESNPNTGFAIDSRLVIAIVCLTIAFLCLCASYLRSRYIRYKEWRLHHNLHYDQLIEEPAHSEYSDFSDLNLDDEDFLSLQ